MNKKHTLTNRKTIALICLLSLIMGSFSVLISAAEPEYVYDTPVDPEMWEEPNFDDPDSYAYSLAFVGDTQCLMLGDRLYGTDNVERLYKYVAGTAEERKLEHVFVLGDITEVGYRNDYNLANKAAESPMVTEEWEIAQKAIFQMNGKVNYSLCRGNHDDYMMDDYFNVPEYTNQFNSNGGFFSDTGAIYPNGGRNQDKNPSGAVYWSALTGAHDETIANSWKTVEICGTKYLFVTVDYNPSKAVADWLNDLLTTYSDHKAIITTHSYMKATGEVIDSEKGETAYPSAYGPETMWKKVYSRHSNVFMIVCGHATQANIPIYTVNSGKNGNTVYQFLINPQTYDLKDGQYGTQDQGLVMYMNFSADGKTISLNYYSTLLNKFLKGANYTLDVSGSIDERGDFDMADLEGQTTPLVTETKTAKLDGVIKDDEYSTVKVTKKEDIGKGSIASDITEYYAYDSSYIYYALKTSMSACKINLHLGSSIYSIDELNSGIHDDAITVSLANNSCTQTETTTHAKIRNKEDMYCRVGTDETSGENIYEIKISRDYLKNNGSPDNLFSYTISSGSAEHRFNLSDDAKAYLELLGVDRAFDWTYNYVYFGSRPEAIAESDREPEVVEPETTDPETTEPEVTEPETTEPEVTEPEVTEPETTEPEVTEPETTEPEVAEPEVTEPEVSEPEVTDPEATEPATTEPATTEAEATEPATTEAEVTTDAEDEDEDEDKETKKPESTKAPETTEKVEEKKGCGISVSVAGIALVAALGTCTVFVAKKKED